MLPADRLAQKRAEIARAARMSRRDPSSTGVELRLRTEYAEAKLADYITRAVDAAPALTVEQRDRLAALLRPVDRPDDIQVGGPDAAA